MAVSVRNARPADAEEIVRLLGDLYVELGEESDSTMWMSRNLVEAVMLSGTEILLAEVDGIIIGLASVTETHAIYAGGAYGVIDEMYVVPEFRGHGVGRHLLGACADIAEIRGWKRLEVTGPTDAMRAERTIRFYESGGFRFTGNKLKLCVLGETPSIVVPERAAG